MSAQEMIDHVLETSPQRWALRLVTVATPIAAVLAAQRAGAGFWPFGVFLIAALGLLCAFQPDTFAPFVVIVAVIWRWLATVDAIESVWLPFAATCLLVFHATTALAATIPHRGSASASLLRRWLWQTALGSGLVVSLWGLVIAFGRLDAAGNTFLTAAALTLVGVAAVVIRLDSVEPPS